MAVAIAAPGGLLYLAGLEKPAYGFWVVAGAFLLFVARGYSGGMANGDGGGNGGD